MTKTRMIAITMILVMWLSQVAVFADNGLVEVEVGIHDKTVYFNNHAMENDELKFPFIRHNDVIYLPLAWNTLKAIGLQPLYKEDVNELLLLPTDPSAKPSFEGKNAAGSKTAKAEVKSLNVKLGEEKINTGNYPILKYSNVLYMPLTWDVLSQLGLFYSSDDLGDMHFSTMSKQALSESITSANSAYVDKLVKFVRGVNRSLSEAEASKIVNTVLKECATYGVDETWIMAMIWQESKFNANCEYAGAVGIMQILVSTGKNFGLSKQDLYNPEKSIKAGVLYVKSGLDRFGSIDKAVLAYNQGSYRVEKGTYSSWYLNEVKEKREALLKKL